MYAFHRSISWRSFSCQRFHYWKRSMRKHRLRSTPLGSANLTSLHKATMQFPSYVQRSLAILSHEVAAAPSLRATRYALSFSLLTFVFPLLVFRFLESFTRFRSFFSIFHRFFVIVRIDINIIRESEAASGLRNIPYDRVKRLYPT